MKCHTNQRQTGSNAAHTQSKSAFSGGGVGSWVGSKVTRVKRSRSR
jgi:hypothetical protein